jgi:hypothetical protein
MELKKVSLNELMHPAIKEIQEEFNELIAGVERNKTDAEIVDSYTWKLETMENSANFYKEQSKALAIHAKTIEKMIERMKLFIRWRIQDADKVLGTRKKIVSFNSVNRSINPIFLTDEDYLYSIDKLTKEEYDKLKNFLSNNSELLELITNKTSKTAKTVTQLPEDHPAIMKQEIKTIQIKDLNQKELAYITANQHKSLLPEYKVPNYEPNTDS